MKDAIARQEWSSKRRVNAADASSAFLRMMGRSWEPPRVSGSREAAIHPDRGDRRAHIGLWPGDIHLLTAEGDRDEDG